MPGPARRPGRPTGDGCMWRRWQPARHTRFPCRPAGRCRFCPRRESTVMPLDDRKPGSSRMAPSRRGRTRRRTSSPRRISSAISFAFPCTEAKLRGASIGIARTFPRAGVVGSQAARSVLVHHIRPVGISNLSVPPRHAIANRPADRRRSSEPRHHAGGAAPPGRGDDRAQRSEAAELAERANP